MSNVGGILARLALLGASLVLSLLLAEGVTRAVSPLHMIERVAVSGPAPHDWVVAGSVYRQVSSEFDARTTITQADHRVPAPDGNPDVVFLGDSFTFGWGLSDDETFAHLYCEASGRSCANLGHPGTGTTEQVERLERFLDEQGWRPSEVKLFVFAMTGSFSAGNDLADNWNLPRWRAAQARAARPGEPDRGADRRGDIGPGLLERALGLRGWLLEHSNLVRVVKYIWGPLLKSWLSPELDEVRLTEALELTQEAFQALDALSRRYGFAYRIYLIHPVQDVQRGTHEQTLARLSEIAPAPIEPTARLFTDDPPAYYFSLDGHLNARGARRVSELLLAEDG